MHKSPIHTYPLEIYIPPTSLPAPVYAACRHDGALSVLERPGQHAGRPAGAPALRLVLPGRHLRGQGAALQDDPAEGVRVSAERRGWGGAGNKHTVSLEWN